MQQLIAKSKNRRYVTFDPVHSHAATHLEDTPQLLDLVKELVSKLILTDEEIAQHFDMGRIIGTCDVVNVNSNDQIIYGVRKNRMEDGLVPFVKNHDGDHCSYVSIHLVPQTDGSFVLSSAWVGTFGDDEPFPLSKDANDKSIPYWNKHAFVYGSQEIILETETNLCPW